MEDATTAMADDGVVGWKKLEGEGKGRDEKEVFPKRTHTAQSSRLCDDEFSGLRRLRRPPEPRRPGAAVLNAPLLVDA